MKKESHSNKNPFVQIFKIWPPGRAAGGYLLEVVILEEIEDH
jgi:hypothetical protein